MPTRAQLQQIRRSIYNAKRKFGSPVEIYQESETYDVATGLKVVNATKWTIRRGVSLPRKVSQNQLLSMALKELFSRGNVTEFGDRDVMLDRTDLPDDFKLGTKNWYMIVDGLRYEIVSHDDYENFAYIVHLKSTTGAPRYAQVELAVRERVTATQGATIEP